MRRVGGRRRRRVFASGTVLAVVGLLLVNAVVVAQQDAEAAGDPTLPLDGGIRTAPAIPRLSY